MVYLEYLSDMFISYYFKQPTDDTRKQINYSHKPEKKVQCSYSDRIL